MSTISKTKIPWATHVYNPVWGCKRLCDYCYARKIAKRFGISKALKEYHYIKNNNIKKIFSEREYSPIKDKLINFRLTFLESNFNKSFPKKPSRIFVNSMSDICYWPHPWVAKVIMKIRKFPQHTFMFLTKDPSIYLLNYGLFDLKNIMTGFTATNNKELENRSKIMINVPGFNKRFFISIEPILEKIDPKLILCTNWVIVGAQTGTDKSKVIPKLEWLVDIMNYCHFNNIPLFLKDNLKSVWGENLIQEFHER